jgi:hypothetical protein
VLSILLPLVIVLSVLLPLVIVLSVLLLLVIVLYVLLLWSLCCLSFFDLRIPFGIFKLLGQYIIALVPNNQCNYSW